MLTAGAPPPYSVGTVFFMPVAVVVAVTVMVVVTVLVMVVVATEVALAVVVLEVVFILETWKLALTVRLLSGCTGR